VTRYGMPSEMLRAWGLPGFEDEVNDLIPGRRFRFDVAHRGHRIAIEIQGGIWMNKSGHNRQGRLRDNEKCNLAQVEGWIVLQFTPQEFARGDAVPLINQILAQKVTTWEGDED